MEDRPGLSALVEVGFTSRRPVVPDQHITRVWVAADTEVEACLVAAQVIACRYEMVTSTRIVKLIL